jgi:NADH:ubiquinone oxidoreductase subunit 2 (subunit N)
MTQLAACGPALVLGLTGLLLFRCTSPAVSRRSLRGLALLGAGVAVTLIARLWGHRFSAWSVVDLDAAGLYATGLMIVLLLLSLPLLEREGPSGPSYPQARVLGVVFFVAALFSLVASTRNVLATLVLLSATALLPGALDRPREEKASRTWLTRVSPLPFFWVSALSLLGGLTVVYGLTGSADLAKFGAAAGRLATGGALGRPEVAAFFILAALTWVLGDPRVFECGRPGAEPRIVTAFQTATAQAALACLLLRVTGWLGSLDSFWKPVMGVFAILFMTAGSVLAFRGRDAGRLLRASVATHAGLILVGVAAGGEVGRGAVLHAVVGFGLTRFAMGGSLAGFEPGVSDDRCRSTARPRLRVSPALVVALLSVGGVPPFVGFWSTFYVVRACVYQDWMALALVAALSQWVLLFSSVRILSGLGQGERKDANGSGKSPVPRLWQAAAVGLIVLSGLYPSALWDLARRTALEFF